MMIENACGHNYSESNEDWICCQTYEKWAHLSCSGKDEKENTTFIWKLFIQTEVMKYYFNFKIFSGIILILNFVLKYLFSSYSL